MLFILVFLLFHIFPGILYSEEDDLSRNTLVLDIETSGYYDLVIWVKKLGIESTGSIEEIRGKLFAYYDIKPDPENNTAENIRSIIIESARELNYINDISIDQDYVILKGEVLLEMIDPDNNTSHKIKADRIVFNQTEKTISAYGNIEYEIIREEDTEYFHGDSLVFEIETWEGIFFEGVSENSRMIEYEELSTTEEVPFFFSGDYIYRSSADQIILNKGSITSSKNKEPYYRIDADKIWVLRPGEWAIKDAVLYVGRIPVLYFPFFFLPGDELLFNPVVGYKEVEGYFINTTTYLVGIKDDEDTDSLSFLKSDNDRPVEMIRNGL
ncbi:MAG: LPS-assembly protein LptD, partial [Spirochaetales bacterium]|nr:LPS-assembly protein LptD [Spirochaetales bacterium]